MLEIVDFKQHEQNTLQGFIAVRLVETGLEIRDIALHQKNGNRWLQLPAKPYTKPNGSKGWSYILNFHEKKHFNKFQEVTLKAFDAFQRKNRRDTHGTDQILPARITSPNPSKIL